MPNIPAQAPAIPPTKVSDIITNAFAEIGVFAIGDAVAAEHAAYALGKINRLLDAWNARRVFVYSIGFNTYAIPVNTQPITIGPGANINVTQRPVKIVAANLILNNVNPSVRQPLMIRDDDWWAEQRVPGVTTTLSTDLYYSPDWPNGNIFLWPKLTVNYPLELETWTLLSKVALADNFSLPPGYEDAVTLTLAESLCPAYERGISPDLARLAQKARATIAGVNSTPPRMSTRDAGMPNGQGNRASFNYRTGLSR